MNFIATCRESRVEESNDATTLIRFHCSDSVRSLFDAPSPVCDVDVFARGERYLRRALDQTGAWLLVDELCRSFATRISLHKCCSARVLQDCRGLGGYAELSLSCCGLLVDYFWNYATGWAGRELPSDSGIAVRCGGSHRTLRGFQCQLDAHHAGDCAACELAGGVARAKSGPDQGFAPWACAKRRVSPAHGRADL